ncbi:MAG: hypothetical protein ACOYNV_12810 [Propionivibrio sp.]
MAGTEKEVRQLRRRVEQVELQIRCSAWRCDAGLPERRLCYGRREQPARSIRNDRSPECRGVYTPDSRYEDDCHTTPMAS